MFTGVCWSVDSSWLWYGGIRKVGVSTRKERTHQIFHFTFWRHEEWRHLWQRRRLVLNMFEVHSSSISDPTWHVLFLNFFSGQQKSIEFVSFIFQILIDSSINLTEWNVILYEKFILVNKSQLNLWASFIIILHWMVDFNRIKS